MGNFSFIWPVCYIIIFLSIIKVFTHFPSNGYRLHIAVVCLLVLQIVDLSPLFLSVYRAEKYRSYVSYQPALQEEAWTHLFSTKTHIVYQPYTAFVYENGGYDLTYLALKNHVTTSNFYLARTDVEALTRFNEEIQTELNSASVREDTIYIFAADDSNLSTYPLYLYKIDGLLIGISEQDPVLENMDGVEKYTPSTTVA